MRPSILVLGLFALAACEGEMPRGTGHFNYVMIDGYRINVAYRGGREFNASGGEETHDKWVKYRQVRAVEVISLCHVASSRYEGKILKATVDCADPRS